MTFYNCRMCWNTNGWICPSGEASTLENGTYVAKHGFGHEEWLFNFEWLHHGNKYGHLQPVSRSRRRLVGETVGLLLYVFGPDGHFYRVGRIDEVRILSDADAQEAVAIFEREGWLSDMISDLAALRLDPGPLVAAPAHDTFNVAFDPGQVHLFDPPIRLDSDDPHHPGVTRYILTKVGSQRLPTNRQPSGSMAPTKSAFSTYRRGTAGMQVQLRHTRLQNALHQFLEGEGWQVRYEEGWVDLTIETEEGDVLIEVKTHPTARGCMREGIGQLLEYAFHRIRERDRSVAALVIVGRVNPDAGDLAYLKLLRNRCALPLEYWHFVGGTGLPSLSVFPEDRSVLNVED